MSGADLFPGSAPDHVWEQKGETERGGQPPEERRHVVGDVGPTSCRTMDNMSKAPSVQNERAPFAHHFQWRPERNSRGGFRHGNPRTSIIQSLGDVKLTSLRSEDHGIRGTHGNRKGRTLGSRHPDGNARVAALAPPIKSRLIPWHPTEPFTRESSLPVFVDFPWPPAPELHPI
jgi:hypothetical protein